MIKYDYESKLALMTSILGFITVIFLDILGLLLGFPLLLAGSYLGLKLRKEKRSNELSKIGLLFGSFGFVYVLVILVMKTYLIL